MLKLIRNLLGEKDLIIDGFDQPAKWSDIVNLVEWEEANGWRAGSKLTWKHVKYDRYKMKVILAAQVFSNSTADALDYLRLDLKEQAFAGSAATSDFCRRVNDAFDLLNARNPIAHGNKSVWTLKNLEEKKNKLLKFVDYMRKWKIAATGQLVECSQRKTCVLGLVTTIHSTIQVASTLLNGGQQHFKPYHTQQDFIEHEFSRYRQRCGTNTNPDVVQVG